MEEVGIGRLIRDASVERIWEGTQNVLALDTIRVITKSNGLALQHLIDWSKSTLAQIPDHVNIPNLQIYNETLDFIPTFVQKFQPALSRHLLNLVGYVASTTCLLQHCIWAEHQGGNEDVETEWTTVKCWLNDGIWRECLLEVKDSLERDKEAKHDRALEHAIVYGRSAKM